MNNLDTVATVLITSSLSALVTYFFTSISRRSGFKALVIKQEKQDNEIDNLRNGMIWIITKLGGNPRDIIK